MRSSDRWDAAIIGGGHNGLVAAAMLAKRGMRVLLLEAADAVGGAARTESFHPGFRAPSLAHLVTRLHPDVIAALELKKHGLDLAASPRLPSVALSEAGEPLVLGGAYGDTLHGAPEGEQAAWTALKAELSAHVGVLKPLLSRAPPNLDGPTLSESLAFAGVGLALRRMGRDRMRDFLRMLLTNVADVLDEHLTDDRLKGLLAFDAVLGSHLGPRSPTSLLGLYMRLSGEIDGAAGAQTVPVGGMEALVKALRASAEAAGVTIRTGAPVASITVERGTATGLVTSSGESVAAHAVLSGIDPWTTFLGLVGARHLDTGFVRRIGNIRMKGDAAKLNLALDRVPSFHGVDADALRGRLVIAPSVDHVERAFNPAKYGAFSPEPVMEITLPSLTDPSLAPAGACVLSAVVQYAPYDIRGGWEAARPAFLAAIMQQLERHAPGIGASVAASDLLTPADIEARYRMRGGHWHHGELQVDQMLVSRPVHGAAGYDTPIGGLYLCGAGSHPGGGITGLPGLNAARRVLGRRRG